MRDVGGSLYMAAAGAEQIRRGALWHDCQDVAINVHGAGLLRERDGAYYWWFDEYKTAGRSAPAGIPATPSIGVMPGCR
ncbi:hypothetical protein [Xanthomonas bonasiae]|uniref:hypothetical protein n=1 Tax=Xanthomonas bonasiae TaxID=2810351 RepID=UPI0019812344|nr:hypothetical protein [Xanthomonas bonasiae]